jgi:hypothetical protein
MGSKKQDLWMDPIDPLQESESMVSFLVECCEGSLEIQKKEGLSIILHEINERIRFAIKMIERSNNK